MVRIPHRPKKKLPARFYRTASGTEPVREWLKALGPEDRRAIGVDIAEAEFDWPVGMPLCRSLGLGLWELRSDISDRRTARLIFCIDDEQMVLLHGFMKKSQRTPKQDLDLAAKRRKEMKR